MESNYFAKNPNPGRKQYCLIHPVTEAPLILTLRLVQGEERKTIDEVLKEHDNVTDNEN